MGRRLSLSRIGALPLARVGALLPGAALAQGWTLSKDRMESGELASLRLPQEAADIHCGVVEGDETALYEMAEFSGPGIVNLVFSEAVFGTATPEKWQQMVVGAEMAGQVIPLPSFEFDELGGSGRVARLHNDLPFIQTAIEGNDMAIVPEIVPSFLLERSALSIGLLE